MDTIHVVVGGDASNRLVRDSIVEMLRRVPDIEPHALDGGTSVAESFDTAARLLGIHNASILIVVSDIGVSPDNLRHYSRISPDLVVIGIESDGQATLIRLEQLGEEVLADLIRSVAARQGEKNGGDVPGGRVENVHVLDTQKVKEWSAQGAARLPAPRPNDHDGDEDGAEHFEDALRWVELRLHRLLLAMEAENGRQASTPGWTLSAGTARQRLGGEFEKAGEQELERRQPELEHRLALQVQNARHRRGLFRVYDAFGLTEVERKMLWACLAVEVDGCYAAAVGVINDDLGRRRPTATTLARLVLGKGDQAFDALKLIDGSEAFSRFGVLAPDPAAEGPRSEAPIAIPGDVVRYLGAHRHALAHQADFMRIATNDSDVEFLGESTQDLRRKIDGWHKVGVATTALAPLLHIEGGDESLRWFERAASESKCPLVVFDIAAPVEPALLERNCLAACRAALLNQAALLVTGRQASGDEQRRRIDELLFAIAGPRVELLVIHGPAPGTARVGRAVRSFGRRKLSIVERAAIWRDRARMRGITLPTDLSEDIAATVRFEEPQIDATLDLCATKYLTIEQFKAAARQVATASLPTGARRIEPCFSFDDIVLRDEVKDELRLIPQHVSYARRVMEDWDFNARLPYGQGVTALFSGPSGTGKTMASQIIANEIGVGCLRVDLSQCRSKWYGESEERIAAVFDAAEKSCAVLQIEEADAMFRARRGDHDRQGQSEVAFLLDRMESYSGVAILTTNLKQDIDTAFLRRIRFTIQFSMPEFEQRLELWQKAFPSPDLLADDVNFDFLARRLEFSGASITTVALRAAFLAAPKGTPITMAHIYTATRQELRKLGMQSIEKKIAELAA